MYTLFKRPIAFVLTFSFIFALSGIVLPEKIGAQAGVATTSAISAQAGDCGWSSGAGLKNCFLHAILAVPGHLSIVVLKLAQWLTHLSGLVLNYVVFYTVVDMKNTLGNAGAVEEAWKAIRDIGNMGFIFVLLYAAISTILGTGGDNKKIIVNIIIAAILINFSLFLTKIVIDISNVLAITFYDAIAPGATRELLTQGVSASLMEPLKLQSIYSSTGALEGGKLLTIGVAGTVFSLIAAFVFGAMAIMLIIRFVVLVFTLILSPIMFLSMVLPETKKYRDQWWQALSGQAFFAPIFFALLWVVIIVSRSLLKSGSAGFGDIAGVTAANGSLQAPPAGTIEMVVNFIIVIAMLIASMVIAKEWANRAPAGVSKMTSWAMGAAGGATVGLGGRLAKNTVGRGAEALKDTATYKTWQTFAPDSRWARLKLAATNKAGAGSFDMRGAPAVGGILSGTLGAGGPAGVGGYAAKQDKKDKESKTRVEAGRKAQGELDITKNLSVAEEADMINAAISAAGGTATPAQTARLAAIRPQVDAFEKAMSTSSDKEIEAIVDSNRGLLSSLEFANKLSVKQLEALNKSDKFSETEKDELKNRRFSTVSTITNPAVVTALNTPAATRTPAQKAMADPVSRGIKALSDSELEMIDPKLLENPDFVGQMRAPQIEGITKSSKFTASQKDTIRGARRLPLMNALTAGNVARIQSIIKKTDHKTMVTYMSTPGRGGINIALDPAVLPIYTPQMLKKMAVEMTQDDIDTLRAGILGALPATHPTVAWLNDPAKGGLDFA